MREGVGFIWMVSLAVTLAAWVSYKIFSAQGRAVNRRRMTGCEMARQFLDFRQLNQVSVQPGGEEFHSLNLSEKIYSGVRLRDLACALQQAVRFWRRSRSLWPNFIVGEWKHILPAGMSVSWILVLAGLLIPAFRGFVFWGQGLFILFFLRALALSGEEWEASEESWAYLNRKEGWGPDEKFRIKRLLRAFRWIRFAEIFEAPLYFLNIKKGKCPTAT